MKCPERYVIIQQNIRKPIIVDIDNISRGDVHTLVEVQQFGECYKQECAAWDKENQICRKVK
ncbi:MAG: hypothetical protein IKM97_04925 [Clostridia bacterium]|nr:hypothetical protein [Clostridia bacterium]